jgi:hypothetical protein
MATSCFLFRDGYTRACPGGGRADEIADPRLPSDGGCGQEIVASDHDDSEAHGAQARDAFAYVGLEHV